MDVKHKKRVAIFVPSLRGGGAERVMVTLANGFAERGLDVDLVLARAEGPYLDDVGAGVRIVDLKSPRVLFSLPRLVGYLRREKPVAMLSALSHANLIAIVARCIARVPMRLVVSERGVPLSTEASSGKKKLVNKGMKALYSYADNIVAVSNDVKRILVKNFNIDDRKIEVINNPIDLSAIREMSEHKPKHSFLSRELKKIVAVGRLEEIKGYDILLRAIGIIGKESGYRLLILGEGSQKASLQDLAKSLDIHDVVDFIGFQKNPFGWMSASDVYVLSSRSDAMPNAMLQALACGMRVVSTDCPGGPAEILDDGRWGRLVPVNDAAALAKAIQEARNDPNPPNVKVRAADFDVDTITKSYLVSMGVVL